jgi:hypothetical protein
MGKPKMPYLPAPLTGLQPIHPILHGQLIKFRFVQQIEIDAVSAEAAQTSF